MSWIIRQNDHETQDNPDLFWMEEGCLVWKNGIDSIHVMWICESNFMDSFVENVCCLSLILNCVSLSSRQKSESSPVWCEIRFVWSEVQGLFGLWVHWGTAVPVCPDFLRLDSNSDPLHQLIWLIQFRPNTVSWIACWHGSGVALLSEIASPVITCRWLVTSVC